MVLPIPRVMIQLVFGRNEDRSYPLIDLTFWSGHDVMEQHNLTATSFGVCTKCHGAVVDYVCLSCYATFHPEQDEEEAWEGLVISGGRQYVGSEIARIWENLPKPSDVSSMYLPFNIRAEEELLEASRRHPVELMEMGSFRVYYADQIGRDLHGRSLSSLFEMFLEL